MNISEKIKEFLNEMQPAQILKHAEKKYGSKEKSIDPLYKRKLDLEDKWKKETDPERKRKLKEKMNNLYAASNRARTQ